LLHAVLALVSAVLAVVTAIVRGGCTRPSATKHGRTRLARADRRWAPSRSPPSAAW